MEGRIILSSKDSKDSKKERILEVALKLFSQKGFHATTTKEIANECGVAEGLIFYYFGDKRKLLLHIVTNFSFALRIQESELQLTQHTLEEALVAYGLKYLQFLKDNMDYIILIWSPEMIQDEEVSQEVRQLIESIGAIGGNLLKDGLPAKEPLSESTYEVAITTMTSSILIYFIINARYGRSIHSLDAEAYIHELVRLLLHGLERK